MGSQVASETGFRIYLCWPRWLMEIVGASVWSQGVTGAPPVSQVLALELSCTCSGSLTPVLHHDCQPGSAAAFLFVFSELIRFQPLELVLSTFLVLSIIFLKLWPDCLSSFISLYFVLFFSFLPNRPVLHPILDCPSRSGLKLPNLWGM